MKNKDLWMTCKSSRKESSSFVTSSTVGCLRGPNGGLFSRKDFRILVSAWNPGKERLIIFVCMTWWSKYPYLTISWEGKHGNGIWGKINREPNLQLDLGFCSQCWWSVMEFDLTNFWRVWNWIKFISIFPVSMLTLSCGKSCGKKISSQRSQQTGERWFLGVSPW